MKIYTTCINGLAGSDQYAQVMVLDIVHQLGSRNMGIYVYDSREESFQSLSSRYDGIIASIVPGDIVFFQHPTWHPLKFEKGLVNRIKAYGGRVIIVVHDIEPLMEESGWFTLGSVIEFYNSAEVLVVASYAMKKILQKNGIRENMKFVVQQMWDCTTDIQFSQTPRFWKEIHFAGNPSKFSFAHQWNFDVPLKIYTSEQCMGKNVQAMGWMETDSLLLDLAKGGFGLVWYKDDCQLRYMKYNNSFKLSIYLAAGLPVIVPRGISNQYLIEKNHLGFVADSLDEAVEQVKKMQEADYQEYVLQVKKFCPLVRNGYFTKKFFVDAVQALMRQDIDCVVSNEICDEMGDFSVTPEKNVNIMDMQETLAYVNEKHISIARFGDGEVDLMTGHSIPYQDYNEELVKRLKQIITMPDNEKLLVCLPDIFDRKERYIAECNAFWDRHFERYHDFYSEVVAKEKHYGSTFFSRPYMDVVDKSISGKHFQNMKDFFSGKDILIVEGLYSRSGVGNDLFNGAKSVERIICPSRNAYSKHGVILDTIRQHGKDKLILLMLGPTAKVLACDLAFDGYWAVDIGHIDSEYEWYRMGVTHKTKLKDKHTAEFNFDENIELYNDDAYTKEIVAMLSD